MGVAACVPAVRCGAMQVAYMYDDASGPLGRFANRGDLRTGWRMIPVRWSVVMRCWGLSRNASHIGAIGQKMTFGYGGGMHGAHGTERLLLHRAFLR